MSPYRIRAERDVDELGPAADVPRHVERSQCLGLVMLALEAVTVGWVTGSIVVTFFALALVSACVAAELA